MISLDRRGLYQGVTSVVPNHGIRREALAPAIRMQGLKPFFKYVSSGTSKDVP
jgi:hypothetical protein